jgi:hypothetical protein
VGGMDFFAFEEVQQAAHAAGLIGKLQEFATFPCQTFPSNFPVKLSRCRWPLAFVDSHRDVAACHSFGHINVSDNRCAESATADHLSFATDCTSDSSPCWSRVCFFLSFGRYPLSEEILPLAFDLQIRVFSSTVILSLS